MRAPCHNYSNDAKLDMGDWGLWWEEKRVNERAVGCDEGDEDVDVDESIEISPPSSFLSCVASAPEDLASSTRVDLSFDYEIHVSESANVTASVETFERDLLNSLGSELGLLDCSSERRSLRKTRKLVASNIVGVDSSPKDREDLEMEGCTVEVTAVDTGNAKCVPIHGYMTAWLATEGDEEVRRSLLHGQSDIKRKIADYAETYSTDDVLVVSYIGERSEKPTEEFDEAIVYNKIVSSEEGPYQEIAGNTSSKLPIGGIAAGAAAAALCLLGLVALFAAKKRRDRKSTELGASSNAVLFDLDDNLEVQVLPEDFETSSKHSVMTEDYTSTDVTLEPSFTFESEGTDSGTEIRLDDVEF